MTYQSVSDKVEAGIIKWSCFECADKHRINKPYDGICTVHNGICDICKQHLPVTSAKKLFGFHKSI